MSNNLTIGITGANGFIGGEIKKVFTNKGFKVISFTRNPRGENERAFNLSSPAQTDLSSLDVLIHCAYDFSKTNSEDVLQQNKSGSLKLFETAQTIGVKKCIFISSMSAFEGARSFYGRGKLEVEKEGGRYQFISIRPGMVYSDQPQGLVGTINKLVKVLPIVPLIGNGSQILYMTHVDDLCQLVFDLLLENHQPQVITYAHPKKITFKELLRTLAKKHGRNIRLIPIPNMLIYYSLKFAETLGLKLPLRSDSVISLMNTNPNPDFNYLNFTKKEPRPIR